MGSITDMRHSGLLLIFLPLFISGCGAVPERSGFFTTADSEPRHRIDIAAIPNAIPRVEAPSPYGNPATYSVFGRTYHVLDASHGFEQQGTASWYGTKFHGRKTSSGEAYDMYAMTAAHKRLPLPTYLEVTNLNNQRTIIVRVNDRGPFVGERILDLSYAAAVKLDIVTSGTAPIKIRAIDPAAYHARQQAVAATPADSILPIPRPAAAATSAVTSITNSVPNKAAATVTSANNSTSNSTNKAADGGLYLQVAAFNNRANAEVLQDQLQRITADAVNITATQQQSGAVYRVRIGPLDSITKAGKLAAQVSTLGLGEPNLMLD